MAADFLLYGSYGYTGRLIAEMMHGETPFLDPAGFAAEPHSRPGPLMRVSNAAAVALYAAAQTRRKT